MIRLVLLGAAITLLVLWAPIIAVVVGLALLYPHFKKGAT